MPRFSGSYPANWQQIADACKQQAGWRCERCGHADDRASGHVLTVHHLDGDKSNCRDWNLAALCQRCHLSIQGRVRMERVWMLEHSPWFKSHAAGYYAHLHGLPDDKEFVMLNIEALLQLGCPWLVNDSEGKYDHN